MTESKVRAFADIVRSKELAKCLKSRRKATSSREKMYLDNKIIFLRDALVQSKSVHKFRLFGQ